MTTCTIIISHYESLAFLRACVRQIKKFAHPEISTKIIIADQSSMFYSEYVLNQFCNSEDVKIAWMKPLYSGYGIDWIIRNVDIKTEYIAQLHCDAFPIHKNWLYLPIKLIEEYKLSFVGQLHFINYDSPTYPPHPFFSMSPTFNVAKTETYKEMSLEAGFTRFHNRPQSGLTFKNDDWSAWASEDYANRGSDDDTVAFWWESVYRNTNKLGLSISGFIESQYGRIIDDIVFHFGSCREATLVMEQMPERYREFTKRINENYDDNLINEMLELAQANKPGNAQILVRNYWDGENKISSPPTEEMNKRIEELKLV